MPLVKYYKDINKDPKIHGKQEAWSQKQRFDACTKYSILGKWTLVQDATGIPIDTLRHWGMTDWWKEMLDDIKKSNRIELGSSLKTIRERAVDHLKDRLEKGDLVYNSNTGKFSRRPLNSKVLSEIMTKTVDREVLLQKMEEPVQPKNDDILARLAEIKKMMLGKVKPLSETVIDVEPLEEGIQSLQNESQEFLPDIKVEVPELEIEDLNYGNEEELQEGEYLQESTGSNQSSGREK